ncbi:hypothetical protein EJ04DRAFT_602052 [Polyplosphaeria fusca]|uniref:Uncharacterized protein n=1 Tax=Polyplosphaeria fusca TaxID=682080 RepID=A0A9P4R0X5_9PLEO|nr:hypothetical protein EJ04DRAFT_602052 [Polyplosphaeria fusca]
MVLESFIEASSTIMSELRLNSQSFSSTLRASARHTQSYHQSPHRTRSNKDLNNGSRRRPTTGDARSSERGPTAPRQRKIAHLALNQQSGYLPHTTHRTQKQLYAAPQAALPTGREWLSISFKLRSKLRKVYFYF